MESPHPTSPTRREIFILRVWQKASPDDWIVEIQNVKTGEVIHLHGLEAISGCIRGQVQETSKDKDFAR
jgi:hypothetical protein